MSKNARAQKEAISVGLVGNCADMMPELARARRRARRSDRPDQRARSAERLRAERHDAWSRRCELRNDDPEAYVEKSMRRDGARTLRACSRLQKHGARDFRLRQQHPDVCLPAGREKRLRFSRLCAGVYSSAVLRRARAVPLGGASGDPADIHVTEIWRWSCFPITQSAAGLQLARERIKFQGLPARICWLGYGERAEFGLAMNDLVARGKLKAPIVIGRDHLDAARSRRRIAKPKHERRLGRDRRLAAAECLLNTAAGASWVSIHNGGGVGIGYSLHAGQVTVADGTEMMAKRIERVLTNDPGIGVARHVDAGYHEAERFAREDGCESADEVSNPER